jgi:hypothetical protein
VVLLRFGWPGPLTLVASIVLAELSYRFIELRFWTPHHEPEAPLLARG